MRRYSDDEAAALYDLLNPWGPSDDFYLAMVMEARSVLDVGCGTGALLHRAREAGHAGRLCGVDPDEASLGVAGRRADIGWVCGTAASMTFAREFELAVMTGHAFQVLVTDEDVRESLAAIGRALTHRGRFAFETRNPLARAWERWTPENAVDVVDPSGRKVRIWHEVEAVAADVVTFTETTADSDGTQLRVDRASLRFLDVDALEDFLAEAGFVIEAQYGSWLREPLEPASPEIVTVARIQPRSIFRSPSAVRPLPAQVDADDLACSARTGSTGRLGEIPPSSTVDASLSVREERVMSDMLEGGCACGEVRYRLTSEPLFTHCCHCLNCQRQTGSAFVINLLIEADRVELLAGEPQPVDVPRSGGKKQRIFRCPICQVAVFSRYTRASIRFVRAGTLDDPSRATPDVHIYTRSKLGWVILPDSVPAFATYYDMKKLWPAESLDRYQATRASKR